eukprot:130662-Rhodomonas_salina.5
MEALKTVEDEIATERKKQRKAAKGKESKAAREVKRVEDELKGARQELRGVEKELKVSVPLLFLLVVVYLQYAVLSSEGRKRLFSRCIRAKVEQGVWFTR